MIKFKATQEQIEKLSDLFSRYGKNRPRPDRNLDQFWATEDTVLQRATLLGNIPNISQKKLLFLGDDDLTSLAFVSLFTAERVTIVDIDSRLLRFLEMVAREEGLPIETFKHNLRDPLPKSVFKRYDVSFFDPPYTPEALNIWLIRAMEATLGGGRNRARKRPETLTCKNYFVCYGYTDRETERGLMVQQIITSLGLVIQEKARDFNHYCGAESIGSKSDLFLLQPTPRVNIRKLDIARSQFYTGQRRGRLNNTKD
jgi:predicted methyltransferase